MELPSSLSRMYAVYENYLSGIHFACTKGCSTCCTQTVTMTTLEAAPICGFLEKKRPDLVALLAEQMETRRGVPLDGDSPPLTTNNYVGLFLARQEVEEEEIFPWCFDSCLFLEQGCCAIYPVRPFGCRSFGSVSRCAAGGAAELPPFVITVNTVLMQIIEDLDGQGGSWGRMNDVLAATIFQDNDASARLKPTISVPGFLVPPEEKRAIGVLLQRLHDAALGDWRACLNPVKCPD